MTIAPPALAAPLSLLLSAVLVLAPARPSAGDLDALVDSEVQAAGTKTLPEVWRRAVELREAEPLGEAGELDRLLDGWLDKRAELDPAAVLLVAAARLPGSSPDATRLADALAPLLDAGDSTLAAAGAELLGNELFKTLVPSRGDEIVKRMLDKAADGAQPPTLRLACAKSAYRIGGGKERLKANRTLQKFLESQDPELKVLGALAMGELESAPIDGELRKILERLRTIPDERGELARSYLEREKLREEKDRQRRDLLKKTEQGDVPPEVKEFLAVLRLIEDKHLEGKQVEQETLVEAAINGMLRYMDPHSSLLPSDDYAKFFGELEAQYGGIGAYVNEDPDDRLFTVVRPIYTGPAYRAGLMTDDKIVRIDDWPTLNQPVDEIIKRLKGKPGTPVNLYVWRHGMEPEKIERPTEDLKVVVQREAVTIPPGMYQMLPGGIGLIQLDTFSQVAMDEIRRWIPELQKLGMKALVLDLRFNGGGLLTEAQQVAELFLSKGKVVVKTKGLDEETVYKTRRDPLLPADIPLVVLTGRSTASAAEIVSGALQDYGRAKLVGKTTYGKGSVQQLMPVLTELQDEWNDENGNQLYDPWETLTKDNDGDGQMDYAPRVKLTIAEYLLPGKPGQGDHSIYRKLDRDGNILSEGGINPDVVVDPPTIEGWRYAEQRRIRTEVRHHVENSYAQNRELYSRLAVNDMKKPELYPGFAALKEGLSTTLSDDDVRRVLRSEVRRRVQDERGAEFPDGDFVEDVQMQKAIEVALSELGQDVNQVADYSPVFDLPPAKPQGELALAGPKGALELERARSLLRGARDGGESLTREQVDELLDILGTIVIDPPAKPSKN